MEEISPRISTTHRTLTPFSMSLCLNEKDDFVTTSATPALASDDSEVTVGLRTWLAVLSGLSRDFDALSSLTYSIHRKGACVSLRVISTSLPPVPCGLS